MEGLKDRGIRKRSRRDRRSGEHLFVACVRGELSFRPILAMDSLEADRQAPGLVRRNGAKEFEGLITLKRGEVLIVGALRIEEASLAGKAAPEIKGLACLGHFVSDPVFSDESGMVASGF